MEVRTMLAIGAVILIGATMLKSESLNSDEKVNNAYDALFKKYATKYGLDWKLLKRIAWNESRIGLDSRVLKGIKNPKDIEGSKSRDGKSWGIMQTTIPTARDYDSTATPEKLNNPEYSISLGAQHVAFIMKKYFKNERDIVMAYNHGQGNQLKFISLEKTNSLLPSQFPDGRHYYEEYLTAKTLIS